MTFFSAMQLNHRERSAAVQEDKIKTKRGFGGFPGLEHSTSSFLGPGCIPALRSVRYSGNHRVTYCCYYLLICFQQVTNFFTVLHFRHMDFKIYKIHRDVIHIIMSHFPPQSFVCSCCNKNLQIKAPSPTLHDIICSEMESLFLRLIQQGFIRHCAECCGRFR